MSIKTSDVNIGCIIGQKNLVHCTKVMQENVQPKEDPIFHRLVCVFNCFQATFISWNITFMMHNYIGKQTKYKRNNIVIKFNMQYYYLLPLTTYILLNKCKTPHISLIFAHFTYMRTWKPRYFWYLFPQRVLEGCLNHWGISFLVK